MIRSILSCVLLILATGQALAQSDNRCDCPECGHKICVAKPEIKKVKKTVFEVEKKDICIPRFRFPWQIKPCTNEGGQCDISSEDCCEACSPRCGRVRTVKVLKKKSVECEKCGYKWEIMTVASTSAGGIFSRRITDQTKTTGCAQSGDECFVPAKDQG